MQTFHMSEKGFTEIDFVFFVLLKLSARYVGIDILVIQAEGHIPCGFWQAIFHSGQIPSWAKFRL